MIQHTLDNQQPNGILNIAHRGASANYPENTMAAFKGAVEAGADMIEVDVRLSQDGIPVIFHNAWLDTPIKAAGYVAGSALTALKKLDAGSWFHPEFENERIPMLDEVLDFASKKVQLNIEMKTDDQPVRGKLENACLELVKKHSMEDQVLFSAFEAEAVKFIKQAEPRIRTALIFTHSLFSNKKPSTLVKKYRADAFHCTYAQLTQKRLSDLKENRIPVAVYTVNNKTTMKKLIATGVNGIITDRPKRLEKVITNMQQ